MRPVQGSIGPNPCQTRAHASRNTVPSDVRRGTPRRGGGPGAREPDRRAHRLQRRSGAPGGARRAHHGRGGSRRRRRAGARVGFGWSTDATRPAGPPGRGGGGVRRRRVARGRGRRREEGEPHRRARRRGGRRAGGGGPRVLARTRVGAQLLARGRLKQFGRLLYESHESCRRLYECSAPELDLVVAAAKGAGALGARLTGAGWGGAVLVLVERKREARITALIRGAFARAYGREPPITVVRAAGGVRRESAR